MLNYNYFFIISHFHSNETLKKCSLAGLRHTKFFIIPMTTMKKRKNEEMQHFVCKTPCLVADDDEMRMIQKSEKEQSFLHFYFHNASE
jgi:hypothetical protein